MFIIKDWADLFENDRSRVRDRCGFCAIPNKQDGLGYGLIMLEENGAALYGAFVAVCLVCSKQPRPRHGILTHNGLLTGTPYTSAELAVKTKISPGIIENMFDVCTRPDVGWIENVTALPSDSRPTPVRLPSQSQGKEKKGEEKKGGEKRREEITRDSTEYAGIVHRPEETQLVKLKSKEDFYRHDVTTLFCSMAGENTGPGVGWMSKQLKGLAVRLDDDARACEIFRDELQRFWSDINAGEQVKNTGAAMTARFKSLMKRHGGIVQ